MTLVLLLGGQALAERLVVSDLGGARDAAGAASLLLRSMLAQGQRPAVPRQELLLSLERVPAARGEGLQVNVSGAAALMRDVGADRLLTGELVKDDVHLTLTLRAYDRDASLIGAVSVRAARGEVAGLVAEGAKKIAQSLGADVDPRPAASLGELRPFVRAAEALAAKKPLAAADALRVANRTVAARVPAAKEVADLVWRDTSLPKDARIVAALAAGETQEAVKLGAKPETVDARAQSARARLAANDVRGAEKDLKSLKKEPSTSPAVALARAELAYKKGKKADAERELVPLLNKSPPDPAALAFVSSLPPGALSAETESLAVTAAQRVSKTEPGVASEIGLRAAKAGGARKDDALALVNPDEHEVMSLDDIDKMFGDAPTGPASLLRTGLQRRKKEAKPVEVAGAPAAKVTATGARVLATPEQAGGGAAAAKAARAIQNTEHTNKLATLLVPLLETFPPLAERVTGTIAVYPSKGGEPPWSIYWVNTTPLANALAHALSSEPYGLGVVQGKQLVGETTHDGLARLARRSGASAAYVMLYHLKADEGEPHVYLRLYDVEAGKMYEYDDKVAAGDLGLVRLNPLLPALGAAAAVVFLLWIVLVALRTGEVVVDIKRDPATENEAMNIVINKSEKPPSITDVHGFHKSAKTRTPKRGRMKHTNVTARSEFPRVPVGTWYVHVYGTCEKGGEIRELPANLTQRVVVKRGDRVAARFDLDPNATEYRVRVTDGEPVVGALVYLDGNKAKVVLTDPQGQAVLHIPRGHHEVCVDAKDMQVRRPIDVVGGKVQVLNVDLVRERREAELAEGIALVEDDSPYGAAPKAAAPALPAGAAAPSNGNGHHEEIDDGISLPEGFQMPVFQTQVEAPTSVGAMQETMAAINTAAQRARGPAPTDLPATVNPLSGMRRYQRVAELGRGAMGIVFKGRDLVLEREVAIKSISDEVRQHPQALQMFFQEAKAMAALNHPNLVTVFDQGQDGDESFMIMEFVDGQTLESVLQQRGTLPLGEALDVADQVCAGLAAAHGRRILHRDLKPANIFLSRDGVVKIGDFGLARAVRQVRLTQTKVVGTPLYMSPEQIRGSDVDFRADLYSVGCTLFELLTGRPPFVTGEVMYHHMYTPPPKPSEVNPQVPPEIDALVLSCLEKEKDARVASAEALRAALRPLRARYA